MKSGMRSIGTASVVAYAVAPSIAVLWIAAAAAGIASGAIDVGINAAVSAETPMATRAAAMAGWNALTGARGIVAAFLMSILIHARIVDLTGALLLCAAFLLAAGELLYHPAGCLAAFFDVV